MLFTCLLYLQLFGGTATGTEVLDQVAAVIDEEVITLSDVRWLIQFQRIAVPEDPQQRKDLYLAIVQQLVEQKLIAAESEQTPGIQVTDEDVERRIEAYKSQFPSEEAFQERLLQMEMTMEDLRELMHRRLSVLQFVKVRFEPFIIVLPNQIQKYYEDELLPRLPTDQPVPPLSSVEEQIREILTVERTNQEVERWVRGARGKAKVEILLYRTPNLTPNLPPELRHPIELQPVRPPETPPL